MKLPEAIESEAYVLGVILNDGDSLADILEILPDKRMLYDGRHRHIYAATVTLYAQNAPVDLNTVIAQLTANKTIDAVSRSFLADLCTNTPASISTATHHAGLVKEKYIEREIYLAAAEIQKRIEQGDVENIRSWVNEKIYEAGRVDSPTPPLWQQVKAALDLNEKGTMQGMVGYPWGLKRLDTLSGGIRSGKTTVVAALKKAGKTKFILRTISELLSADIPVLFFSLEMRATAVLNWLVSYRERINSGIFETDRLSEGELQRTARCLAGIADQNKLVIFDRSFPALEQIRQEVRREVQRRGVKVVVLDFIQRVNVEQQKGESRAVALQRFSYRLADMARDYDVALILVAQFSNEAERTQSLHMGLIKESGGIAEAADVILFLDNKRRTRHKTTQDPSGKTEIDLIVEGQRNGVSGIKIPMTAELQFGRFTENPPANQANYLPSRKDIAYAQD